MASLLFERLAKKQAAYQFGKQGEQRATAYLQQQGLRLVAENYRCRFGEIDRIMQDGDALVFVEVKSRMSDRQVAVRETITARKKARLLRTAMHFLHANAQWQEYPMRFDCVLITAVGERIEWIQDIAL